MGKIEKFRRVDHIDVICKEIERYNRKHGTRYSYGQYTALVRLKKIKPEKKKQGSR